MNDGSRGPSRPNSRSSAPVVLLPLAAALLFGASTPLAKVLLARSEPVLLAGLLYLGSGVGLAGWQWLGRRNREGASLALERSDLPWLAGAILAGGVVAPVLLLFGLRTTPASSASLLLNLESVFTAGLAWWVFHEHFDRRLLWGMAAITAGCLILSWTPGARLFLSWGALAVAAACLGWGIDNNLTRKISAGDPILVAAAKGLVAGAVNLGLALALGAALPGAWTAIAAGAVGLVGYGFSLVLFVLSLRHLGTARTVAYFSVAPFVGSLLSLMLLGERVSSPLLAGALLTGAGVFLYFTEQHKHDHVHEPMEHAHTHRHDEHHAHDHAEEEGGEGPHAHRHEHPAWMHSHPHYPDIHHRHQHP